MTRIIAGISRRMRRHFFGPLPDDPARFDRNKTSLSIDLSRRVVLLTGATGELGRAATCGAKVAIHYFRPSEAAEAVCGELRAVGTEQGPSRV